jgi:hypothetical protein
LHLAYLAYFDQFQLQHLSNLSTSFPQYLYSFFSLSLLMVLPFIFHSSHFIYPSLVLFSWQLSKVTHSITDELSTLIGTAGVGIRELSVNHP